MKKIALFAIIGMLTLGASSLVVTAQTLPTGAPDTSVTRPKATPPVTVPETRKTEAQEVKKESDSTTSIVLGILAVVVIAGISVVLIRRNKSKK